LNLALGDRADVGVIRHGCERAEITASFDISAVAAAQAWLKEHELDADAACLMRRIISQDGRSKGFINGSPVTMQSLRELGEMLVDIHGQHEHQSLLCADIQRQLLDDFAGHTPLVNEIAALYQRWKDVSRDLHNMTRAADDRIARYELLNYQAHELEALNLSETELDELNEEHTRLSHAARLLEVCQTELQSLYENDETAALSLVNHAVRELAQLQEFDKRLASTHELLAGAAIQIQEGVNELRHYLDGLELDPTRLNWIEQRLTSVHDLARKHKVAPRELPPLLVKLQHELTELQDVDVRRDQLQADIKRIETTYRELAKKLSSGRATAARKLAEQVSANMQQLNMPGGRFEPVLEPLPDEQFSPGGMERVEFMVCANPGQPLRPLTKVASGGELSRISLAIQVITAQNGRIPTLIFDEVDVGIGGAVAEIVGQQLHALSQSRQVLCVTHLPQVAAQGHHHLQVNKQTGKGVTQISLKELSSAERADEIARMLGGVKITEQTRLHALEMLEGAQLKEQKLKKTGRNFK